MRYFNLFSNIFVTKGTTRILISDLQRNTSELMPLELDEIIEEVKINSCGKVDLKYFNTNLPKILEAINHNSCLHKKISIDYRR